MSQDTFDRAARAVRETYDGTSTRGEATRRSLLARAIAERRRRRTLVAYVLPLAAALVLSTAWAAVTGRLRWGFDGARGPSPSPSQVVAVGARGIPSAASLSEAPTAPEPPPSVPADEELPPIPSPPVSSRGPDVAHPRVAPPPRPAIAPRPAPTAEDPEESLFAAAHRLHFVDHDSDRALKGWDAYLAAYPSGRFALEARYNRALTLVRLDRRADARAALVPFADGTYGGYRQREAAELLDALGLGGSP